jgi:phosphoserine phosphatase
MSILNHPALRDCLARHSDHTSGKAPLAIFDCDGTVIKGDIGEAMLYYQLEHFLFRVSPASIWEDHPQRQELDKLFSALKGTSPEQIAHVPSFPAFCDIVLSWYFGQIAEGNVEKACANIVQLLTGFSLPEVRYIAEATLVRELEQSFGERLLGRRTLPTGIRFIKETVELLDTLREEGFEIWAVSGSSKWSVEPVFNRLGVPEERILGIELLSKDGVLLPEVRKPVPIRGKKVDALRAHRKEPPALVASDSRNDIPLFLYSSDLRVLVNSRTRTTEEFFLHGNVTRDATWIVIEQPTVEPGNRELWQTYR